MLFSVASFTNMSLWSLILWAFTSFGIVSIVCFSYVKHLAPVFPLRAAGLISFKYNGLVDGTSSKQHHIMRLVEIARAKHADMPNRQSKTLEEAVIKY